MPLIRGDEATAEVVEGSQSIRYDQAENRLHAQKAILASLIGHAAQPQVLDTRALRHERKREEVRAW